MKLPNAVEPIFLASLRRLARNMGSTALGLLEIWILQHFEQFHWVVQIKRQCPVIRPSDANVTGVSYYSMCSRQLVCVPGFSNGNKTIHRQDNSSTRFLETIHRHN